MCLAVTRSQGQVGAARQGAPCDSDKPASPDVAPGEGYVYAKQNETYTYFEVDPPTDRRMQCACEHSVRGSDVDATPAGGHSLNEMEGDNDEHMHTLRCTNVVEERDYALGWRLCMSCRPSEETIQDRVYAVLIAAYDYVEEYEV